MVTEYCGSNDGCLRDLWLFGLPLFVVIIAYIREKQTLTSQLSRFGGNGPTFSEAIFGKRLAIEGYTIKLVQAVDVLRIVLSLVIAAIPLVALSLANQDEKQGEDKNSTDYAEYGLDGLHVWVDNFVVDGPFPQILFSLSILYEIRGGKGESRLLIAFSIIMMLAHLFKVVLILEDDLENDTIDVSDLVLFSNIVELVMKVLLAFSHGCFNRDIRKLRESIHKMGGVAFEKLLDEYDSFDEYADVDSQVDEEAFGSKFKDDVRVKRTPEEYSGLFSRLTFSWMGDLFKKGYERPLEEEDFYKIRRSDEATAVSQKFVKCWKQEVERNTEAVNVTKNAKEMSEEERLKNSDYWMLVKSMHNSGLLTPFYEAALFKIVYDTLNFVPPRMINGILTFMNSNQNGKNASHGLIYVGILFLSSAIQTFVLHCYFHRNYRTGIRVRSALVTAIYDKSLNLSPDSKTRQTVGQIVNLMSTDTNRLQNLFTYLHIGWSAIYVIILSSVFLWFQLKYAVFVALGVVVLIMLPLTSLVTKKIKKSQKAVMKVKDERIKLTSETISSIKVLKLYGWERAFKNKVDDVRARELTQLAIYLSWRVTGSFMWPATPIVMTLCTFATYTIVQGQVLTAATAFTALSLLNILRFPLAMLPNIVNSLGEATVSSRRISLFLLSEEIDQTLIKNADTDSSPNKPALKLKGSNFYWDDMREHRALKNIDVEIAKGDLCMITGKVGSGKTALLKLLINDLVAGRNETSTVNVNGSIAYSAQEPWIQNATVKDNILFGKPFESDWYEKVTFACALTQDFAQLPHGDATEIGERGINLSGGQKARISLARAVYSRSNILLLESCFEAVDEHVGDHLWKHCFMDLLRSDSYGQCTVLLVTHALKRLRSADKIIVMTDGEIIQTGSYDKLKASAEGAFHELMEALEKQHEGTEQNDTDIPSGANAAEGDTNGKKAVSTKTIQTKTNGNNAAGKDLTGKEERGVGKVSNDVYWSYIQGGGGMPMICAVTLIYTVYTGLDFLTNKWLAYWSTSSERHRQSSLMQFPALAGTDMLVELQHCVVPETEFLISDNQTSSDEHSVAFYLSIYTALSFGSLTLLVLSMVSILYSGYIASIAMHKELILKMSRAPMSFFDTTPSGRILNRFSKDIYTVDEILPSAFVSLFRTSFSVIGTVFSISYVAPQFLIAVPFLAIFYRSIQKYYIASSRELKRWDSVLRSPIYSFFTETLEGVSTIRAYDAKDVFAEKNMWQVDKSQRAYYLSVAANRWLAVRLEFVGTFLVVFASAFIVLRKGKVDPGSAGFALTYAFGITQTLNWTVRMFSELETNIVSVERLTEYIGVKSEAAEESSMVKKIKQWPSEGVIEFKDLTARYREGLPLVLNGLNFSVKGGEKVGIVGRTGAGKSSLFLVILRLVEPSSGSITIDGINLQDVGLLELRCKLAMIPQDPVMFSGTVRQNLDPTESFSEEDMAKALKLCKLDEHLKSVVGKENLSDAKYPELDVEISESGSNLSFGQKQLLCIARAVLRNCKVLLLDEATSGIDLATDSLIQETIRTQFQDRTVLTVAHRIETILGGDRVLVLDDGQVSEFDDPQKLLQNSNSMFSQLVERMRSGREDL